MIEVSGLTKTYGNKRGITDISFTINEGEIVGFLGPNGAGKSTTMNDNHPAICLAIRRRGQGCGHRHSGKSPGGQEAHRLSAPGPRPCTST